MLYFCPIFWRKSIRGGTETINRNLRKNWHVSFDLFAVYIAFIYKKKTNVQWSKSVLGKFNRRFYSLKIHVARTLCISTFKCAPWNDVESNGSSWMTITMAIGFDENKRFDSKHLKKCWRSYFVGGAKTVDLEFFICVSLSVLLPVFEFSEMVICGMRFLFKLSNLKKFQYIQQYSFFYFWENVIN